MLSHTQKNCGASYLEFPNLILSCSRSSVYLWLSIRSVFMNVPFVDPRSIRYGRISLLPFLIVLRKLRTECCMLQLGWKVPISTILLSRPNRYDVCLHINTKGYLSVSMNIYIYIYIYTKVHTQVGLGLNKLCLDKWRHSGCTRACIVREIQNTTHKDNW